MAKASPLFDERLPELLEHFTVDFDLKEKIQQKQDDAIAQMHRKLKWKSAMVGKTLKKMEHVFLGDVATEHISVSCICEDASVSTVRSRSFPEWFRQDVEKLHDAVNEELQRARMARLQFSDDELPDDTVEGESAVAKKIRSSKGPEERFYSFPVPC